MATSELLDSVPADHDANARLFERTKPSVLDLRQVRENAIERISTRFLGDDLHRLHVGEGTCEVHMERRKDVGEDGLSRRRCYVDGFNGSGEASNSSRVDTEDIDAVNEICDNTRTKDVLACSNGSPQLAPEFMCESPIGCCKGILKKAQAEFVEKATCAACFGQRAPCPMRIGRNAAGHGTDNGSNVVAIENGVVALEHDLDPAAPCLFKFSDLAHDVGNGTLIDVIARDDGHLRGGSESAKLAVEGLLCLLAGDVPKRNVKEAQAARQCGPRGNIALFEIEHHLAAHRGIFAENAARHVAQRLKQWRPARIADGFSADALVRFNAEHNEVACADLYRAEPQDTREGDGTFSDGDLCNLHLEYLTR